MLAPPGLEYAVSGNRCRRLQLSAQQLSGVQVANCFLDGALRQPGSLCDGLVAGADERGTLKFAFAREMEVDKIAGRIAVVPDHIAHQSGQGVVIKSYRFCHYSYGSYSKRNDIDRSLFLA